MGYYMAGDYYAAGGIFGDIFGAVKGAVGGFLKGGPLGAVTGAVGGYKRSRGVPTHPTMSVIPPAPGFGRPTLPAIPTPGLPGVIQRVLPGGKSGYQSMGVPAGYHLNKATNRCTGQPPGSYLVRNRSMNPGNARALRRAIRRESAFVGLAKRTLKGSGYTFKRTGAPKSRRRKR